MRRGKSACERLGGGGRRVKTESEERDEKEKGGCSLVASLCPRLEI